MGRQSWKIAFNSVNSANHFFLRMEAKPIGSETIADPVEEFKKNKGKREAKRKQVTIQEYVPPVPAPEPVPVPEPEPEPEVKAEPAPEPVPVSADTKLPDAESIAARVAEMLFAKMAVEKNEVTEKTPPRKTKAKPKPPAKKKEVQAPAPPPPTKYFGWC